jgi:hypothetical protein
MLPDPAVLRLVASTTQISRRSAADYDSKPSTAGPTRNRSGRGPVLGANTVRRASSAVSQQPSLGGLRWRGWARLFLAC